MDIWEQKVFKISVQLHKSMLRLDTMIKGNNKPYNYKNRSHIERKNKFLSIPKIFSPVKENDMPLDKLLEKYPQYRYDDRIKEF